MKTITLEGPGRNALSTALISSTIEAIDAAGDDAILLTGDGPAFCSGLYLAELVDLDLDGMKAWMEHLGALVHKLYHHPAPTVCYANGHAVAGGCVLMFACDHRIIADHPKAKIGLTEVALGLRFPPLILHMLNRHMPRQHVARAILGAELMSPAEAVTMGLADELGTLEHAQSVARRLGGYARDAYAATKAVLRPPLEPSAEDERQFVEEVLTSWASPERKALMRMFLGR